MAKVVITITDEVPDQALSISMDFEPAIKRNTDPETFQRENPLTHVAAYMAWAAIDDLMDSEPTVETISRSQIVI